MSHGGHHTEEELIIINGTGYRCTTAAAVEMTRTLDDPRVLPQALRRQRTGQDGGALARYVLLRDHVIAETRKLQHVLHEVLDPIVEDALVRAAQEPFPVDPGPVGSVSSDD